MARSHQQTEKSQSFQTIKWKKFKRFLTIQCLVGRGRQKMSVVCAGAHRVILSDHVVVTLGGVMTIFKIFY